MGNVYRQLGKRIRVLRKQMGMTQAELAEKADVSENYVGQIERGEASPAVDKLSGIATALKVPIGELFDFPEDQPENIGEVVNRLSGLLRRRDLRDTQLLLTLAKQIFEHFPSQTRKTG